MTSANYTDDLVLLANTPDQAESLLHNLEQAAGSIGLHINANKTEFTCFKQEGTMSPLKLIDKFPYFSSNILSTESDIVI